MRWFQKKRINPVIDYKTAVQALTNYYTQSISEKKLCFVRAELKLVAMERKKEIVLSPMWIFSSTDEGASPLMKYKRETLMNICL